ncbi:MAG TPA: TonB family protein [Rhizomicrobium sp.]|nr:TonB family protein [Rhizomicrobium sp.]
MQRPISHVLTTQRSPERKAASAVAVGALHVALIAALLAGLAPPLIKTISHPIDVFLVKTTQSVAEPPKPTVTMTEATVDTVPQPPKWTTSDNNNQITVAHNDNPPPTSPGPVAKILPTAPLSLAATHTTPPYPPLSRRLGEEGKVGLRIFIAADGHISDVQVEKSSGLERLDEAARDWVRAHWLYRPATREGKTIAAQTEAVVVFNLKTAQR